MSIIKSANKVIDLITSACILMGETAREGLYSQTTNLVH